MTANSIFLFMVLGVILMSGCTQPSQEPQSSIEGVGFETSDGFSIMGNFYPGDKAVILLHMLSRDRSSWNVFAEKLNENGYAVLSIDLRGHGQSVIQNGVARTFPQFSDDDFRGMVLDVQAAKNFLVSRGFHEVSIIGASIGANVALRYASSDSVNALILLSPGLNYRGVATEDVIQDYSNPILIVVSEDDPASASASNQLYELSPSQKEIKIYQNAGHGTNMFSGTDMDSLIIQWLDDNF